MKKNIGLKDRIVRGLIGCVFLFLAWWYSSWILLAIALFTFYEAIQGWCILYQFLGKSSCSVDLSKKTKD